MHRRRLQKVYASMSYVKSMLVSQNILHPNKLIFQFHFPCTFWRSLDCSSIVFCWEASAFYIQRVLRCSHGLHTPCLCSLLGFPGTGASGWRTLYKLTSLSKWEEERDNSCQLHVWSCQPKWSQLYLAREEASSVRSRIAEPEPVS